MMTIRDTVVRVAMTMVVDNGLINLSCAELCKRANIPDGSWYHIMGCNFSDFVDELRKKYACNGSHKVVKYRANPTLRKEHILSVALKLSENNGVDTVQRNHIADSAGVSVALVSRYFGTIKKLRRTIVRAAIKQENLPVIAYAIISHNTCVKKISIELRTKALEHFKCI